MKKIQTKRILKRVYCLLLTVLLSGTSASAVPIGERTKVSLTLADGLAGETVYSIFTSHNGDTWIGTNSGVNCYNGRSMHAFVITGQGGRPLEVYDLCEAGGYMYAATAEGLYRMSYAGGSFERVPFDTPVGSPLSSPEVGSIASLLAVGDTVYMGSQQGLLYYDGRTLHHQDVSVSRKGLDNIVRQYVADAGGKIWFLGRFDLNCFDPRTGKTVRYALPEPLPHSVLTRFAIAADGLFIIGTRGNGLFTYHLPTGTLQQVDGVGKIVMSVQRSADGHICVGTDGAGAYLLKVGDDRQLAVVQQFSTDTSRRHDRLPTNGIYCYYRDANGVDWFGFVRYGLMHSYHSSNLFRLFSSGEFTTEGINVRTAHRHGPHIVLGTQDGFYYVNSETGRSRYFSPDELCGGHIVNTVTWYDGRFFIGTFDGGLHVLDPATLVLSQQHIPSMLTNGSIGDVKTGPDGRLWIGCGKGLIIVSDGQVEQHFTEQNSRIVGGLILNITFDTSGNAWLTGASGCSLYSTRSREIVDTSFPKGFFHQQPWMRGAQGHDGLVFLRTGPQTFYTNEGMTDFGELRLPVQFRDKWCRSFIDDMQGHYLLASERGVFRFDYDASSPKAAIKREQSGACSGSAEREQTRPEVKGAVSGALHFGAGEGLRGDFINDLMLSDDGHLWVTTSQGLYVADMQHFREWQQQSAYKVRLSAIRRGSDLVDMAEEYRANEEHSIRLSWNLTSEVLQAEAFLPDYAKPTGRIYEYRVGGGDWQMVDGQQPLRVSGLQLGSHPLEVRLAGAPGTSQVYTLTVLPSAWAYIEGLLLLIAATLLWLWWRYRKNTRVLLSERDEIEDALVESEELRMKSEDKYQKVKLDEAECADIVSRMKEYVERERVYTNQELKMKDLADVLHLSAPKLSQVFNLYLGQNYYDFINGYRLQEFKRLISEGAYKRYTITALSEQCGFKKSNFFSTFRKVEGMTPTEYLKKIGVKMS
mgnify:CR=1 FL=1